MRVGGSFDIVKEVRLLLYMKAGNGVWVDVSFREYGAMVQLFKGNGLSGGILHL